VASDKTRNDADFGKHTGDGDRYGKDSGLGDLGEAKLLVRSLKAAFAEVIAESLVGLFKGAAGYGVIEGEFLAHSGGL
jgi:hypothetical protein